MTTTSDTAAAAAICAATRELRLPGICEHHQRLADQAARTHTSHLGFLAEALTIEVDDRAERRRSRRITEAKFPRPKRLEDFDYTHSPVNPATIANLATGNYLNTGDPIVLLGDSGAGKTHLLIALGYAACEQGHRVRYTTCAQLANELAEAADEQRLGRLIARYARLDLLIIDELGYIQLDTRGAELLFQVLTARDETASIAVGTNPPHSANGATYPSRAVLMSSVGLDFADASDVELDAIADRCYRVFAAEVPERVHVANAFLADGLTNGEIAAKVGCHANRVWCGIGPGTRTGSGTGYATTFQLRLKHSAVTWRAWTRSGSWRKRQRLN